MPRSGAALSPRASAELFSALGDETRLRLVRRLSNRGPQSIARLTEVSEVSRQAVTKHLRVLEGAGVLFSRQDGRETVWGVRTTGLKHAGDLLAEISGQWDAAIGRLRDFVER